MNSLSLRRMSSLPTRLLFLSIVVACGCSGGGEDGRFGVRGKVTFRGEPVVDGRITFLNLAEGGSSSSAAIVNGEYEIPAKAGAKAGEQVVQIEAYRESRKRTAPPAGYLSAEQVAQGSVEQYLPDNFNAQSELKVEITPDGDNEHDFELEASE